METEDLESKMMWRIRKTVFQMVHDRGYLVTQFELDETLEDFEKLFIREDNDYELVRSELTTLFMYHDNPEEKLIVFYPEVKYLNMAGVRTLYSHMEAENIHRALMIVQTAVTPAVQQVLDRTAAEFRIELFYEIELMINITQHVYTPKYDLLKPDEVEALLTKLNTKVNLLAKMELKDPVSRYFGFKRGQVIKITRDSETSGICVSYRLVC